MSRSLRGPTLQSEVVLYIYAHTAIWTIITDVENGQYNVFRVARDQQYTRIGEGGLVFEAYQYWNHYRDRTIGPIRGSRSLSEIKFTDKWSSWSLSYTLQSWELP